MKTLLAVIGQNLDMRCYLITGFLATELQTCFPLVSKTIQYTQYSVHSTQYSVHCFFYLEMLSRTFTWQMFKKHTVIFLTAVWPLLLLCPSTVKKANM